MSKQKRKGSSWERKVAKYLTDKFELGEFFRTPHSGSYIGGKNKDRTRNMDHRLIQVFNGDVIPPEGVECVIECKNYSYKEFNGGFHSLIKGESKTLNKWLTQLRNDSRINENGYLFHFLFMKITNYGEYIVFPLGEDILWYVMENGISFNIYYFKETPYIIMYLDNVDEKIIEMLKERIKGIVGV